MGKGKRSKEVYRIVCPHCHRIILRTTPADDDLVQCPRCGRRFAPQAEDLLDPEDD